MPELVEAIAASRVHLGNEGLLAGALQRSRGLIASAAKELLEQRLQAADGEEMQALAQALLAGDIDLETAASRALKLISRET